jgi:AraC-like DNA-binding protein
MLAVSNRSRVAALREQSNATLQDVKTRDFAQYSRVFGLDGLEIMSARWVEHSFTPHMHDFYAVSLNYGGRGAFHCHRELRHATPGTCNLIAPGELHTGHAASEDGWRYSNLHLEMPLMATLLRGLDWQSPLNVRFKFPLVNDAVLARRLARVFSSLTESGSLLENESLLMSVVARLATHHFVPGHSLREAGREHAAVRRVREWLDAHPEQDVSVRSLAEIAGLSPYYLVRVFHKYVGIPPHQYRRNLRVLWARKLLKAGEPISEVAYRTGFCDQSHLNRCFRAALGVTPGRYSGCLRAAS